MAKIRKGGREGGKWGQPWEASSRLASTNAQQEPAPSCERSVKCFVIYWDPNHRKRIKSAGERHEPSARSGRSAFAQCLVLRLRTTTFAAFDSINNKMSGQKSVAFMNHKPWHPTTFQNREVRLLPDRPVFRSALTANF